MPTTHFIVKLFMSKVYNVSCFKINQRVSRLFLWICMINYAQLYKSSHAVFYDLVNCDDNCYKCACPMNTVYGYLSINFANRNDMLHVWY